MARLGEALERELNPLRKALQAGLRTTGHMRSIFQQSDDAILIADADTLRVPDCNPRTCVLLGCDWSPLSGTPLASLLQHVQTLRDSGCRFCQGDHFARPLSTAKAVPYLIDHMRH